MHMPTAIVIHQTVFPSRKAFERSNVPKHEVRLHKFSIYKVQEVKNSLGLRCKPRNIFSRVSVSSGDIDDVDEDDEWVAGKALPGEYNFADNYMWGSDGIRQNNASFEAMSSPWEASVEAFWEDAMGASPPQILRLTLQGAKWQKDTPCTRLFRDPASLAQATACLQAMLPGADLLQLILLHPPVLLEGLDARELSRQVAALSRNMPDVDLIPVISKCPQLICRDPDQEKVSIASPSHILETCYMMETLIPGVDIHKIIENYPQVLKLSEDELKTKISSFRESFPQMTLAEISTIAETDMNKILRQ